mmetsp:Transcript_106765/g.227986  ORF Transcript_106765/g.227986 Transcript_106765/m.227986 type:complete len:324 (+) Transcript_106765:2725-3696(+)
MTSSLPSKVFAPSKPFWISSTVRVPSPLVSIDTKALRRCAIFSSGKWCATAVMAARSRSFMFDMFLKPSNMVSAFINGASRMFLFPALAPRFAASEFTASSQTSAAISIQLLFKASVALGRRSGSKAKHLSTKSRPSEDIASHAFAGFKIGASRPCFRASAASGHVPLRRKAAIAPMDQISHCGVRVSISRCSGDWHCKLPAPMVLLLLRPFFEASNVMLARDFPAFWPIVAERPKSTSFKDMSTRETLPRSSFVNRKFSGLRSVWQTPCMWRWAMALSICRTITEQVPSVIKDRSAWPMLSKFFPKQSSMTEHKWCSPSNVS